MQFEWIKGSGSTPIVTIYENNLTLNNAAAHFFQESKFAMLGINHDDLMIAIKPIKKRELDLKLFDESNLNKVSIGKGYARISNKNFIEEVKKVVQKDVTGIKFEASFHDKEGMLIVHLREGETTI